MSIPSRIISRIKERKIDLHIYISGDQYLVLKYMPYPMSELVSEYAIPLLFIITKYRLGLITKDEMIKLIEYVIDKLYIPDEYKDALIDFFKNMG